MKVEYDSSHLAIFFLFDIRQIVVADKQMLLLGVVLACFVLFHPYAVHGGRAVLNVPRSVKRVYVILGQGELLLFPHRVQFVPRDGNVDFFAIDHFVPRFFGYDLAFVQPLHMAFRGQFFRAVFVQRAQRRRHDSGERWGKLWVNARLTSAHVCEENEPPTRLRALRRGIKRFFAPLTAGSFGF